MNSEDLEQLNTTWTRFVDELEPLRPNLFRFSLSLTGNPFDAEDLVAESMLRIFSSLAFTNRQIENLEAYAIRCVSRMWIDQQRRAQINIEGSARQSPDDPSSLSAEVTHATAVLYTELNPVQRATIVLKEVFDLSHAEIAQALSISEGNARVNLHRASKRLIETHSRKPRASRETVERFVEVFQTYDVNQIKKMLIEDLETDVFPSGIGLGAQAEIDHGWVGGALYLHNPERNTSASAYPSELQIADILGDIVLLVSRGHGTDIGRALEEVWLIEENDGRVSRIRDYGFSPDLTKWVAAHLRVPARTVGYRLREDSYDHLV